MAGFAARTGQLAHHVYSLCPVDQERRATRYEKLATHFAAMVTCVYIIIWLAYLLTDPRNGVVHGSFYRKASNGIVFAISGK